MSKINKKDFLDGVHNIIKESLTEQKTPNIIDSKFNMKKSINILLECVNSGKDSDLMNYLSKYNSSLTGKGSDILMLESFCKGLTKFSKENLGVKTELRSLLENVNANRQEYVLIRLYESIKDSNCKALITEALNKYLYDKSETAKLELNERLINAFAYHDEAIKGIYNVVNENLYTENSIEGRSNFNNVVKQPNYISLFENLNNVISEVEEQKEEGVVLNEEKMNTLYSKIDDYVNERINEALKEKNASKYTLDEAVNSTGLRLRETLIKIGNKTKNEKVKPILERYERALNDGVAEERLCEAFISDLKPYSIDPAETELSALEKRLNNARVQVDLVKILDLMKESTSYFIVPHIETDVIRYVKEKTPINRVQLENACGPFASDPYVRQILTLVMLDNDRRTVNAGLEESVLSIEDQAKIINENANISDVYSPIQYIKEGVAVFNVNNKFYVKKGALISKLDNQYLPQLSESFIQLCKLVNDDNVEIHDNYIDLYSLDESLHGKIYDGYAVINENKESKDSLRNLNEMFMKYNNYDTNFFIMASCLLENFNNIAKVDFVKHVELNEDANINLDLFLLNEKNMYILTSNEHTHSHVFYRNVNPIQCKNIMNEHMGLNVSYLFENLLPNQDKIIMMINETKDSYEKDIEKLEKSIEELKDAKKDVDSKEDKEKIDDAIKATQDKLDDTKKEYKEWKKEADKELDSDSVKNSEKNEVDDYDSSDVQSDESDDDTPDENYDKDDLTTSLDNINEPVRDESQPLTTENTDDDYDQDSELDYDPNDFELPADSDEDIVNQDENDFDDINSADDVDIDLPADVDDDAADSSDFDLSDDADSDEDENPDDFNPDDATDIFDTDDSEEDTASDVDDIELDSEQEIDVYDNDFKFKIVNVLFDENIKTGEKYKSGNVSYIVPMIQADGTKYADTKNIRFNITDDNDVYLANDAEISEELYNSIIDTIKNAPDFSTFASEGTDFTLPSSDDSEASDVEDVNVDDIFNTSASNESGEDEFSITTDDGESYDFDLPEDGDIDVTVTKDSVPVYKNEGDDTEYELPAANVDGTEIKESLLDIRSNFKKAGKSNTSKKKRLLNEKEDEELKSLDEPAETEYSDEDSLDVNYEYSNLEYLQNIKENLDLLADQANDGISQDAETDETDDLDEYIDISEVKSVQLTSLDEDENEVEHTIQYIKISQTGYLDENPDDSDDLDESLDQWPIIDENNDDFKSYTLYTIDEEPKLYYVSSDDFDLAIKDDEDPLEVLSENDSVDIDNVDDKNELIETIITSISGVEVQLTSIDSEKFNDDYENDDSLNEKLKINKTALKRRKESLGNAEDDGPQDNFDDSKFVDEIFNGDADEKEHEAEMNSSTGTNENFKPKLPSFHASKKLTESRGDHIKKDFEPNETALFKGELVSILTKNSDDTFTILDKDGLTIDVTRNQLTPIGTDTIDNTIDNFGFGKGKDDKWRVPLEKDEMNTKYANFNKSVQYLPSNIVNSGLQLNTNECFASMKDLMAKKHRIKVINESGEASFYPIENIEVLDIDQDEWPYAVIVSGEDDEPNRKIRINPKSYIDALTDDDTVECLVADKLTELPKGVIRIIS